MKQLRTHFLHAGAVLLAVAISWFTHELAHWCMAKALGYSPIMTMNTVSIGDETYTRPWHAMIVSAAGPVITIIQAILVYWWLSVKGWQRWLYPYLLLALYTRFLAGVFNVFNLNDEGRIGHALGIGDYTLSILVSGFLFWLVWKSTKQHKPGWRFISYSLFLIMVFGSIVILGDNAWKPVLLR